MVFGFLKPSVREREAAEACFGVLVSSSNRDWPSTTEQLKKIGIKVNDESNGRFFFLLGRIATEMQAIPNLFPVDQAARLRTYWLEVSSPPEFGSEPLEIILEYEAAWKHSINQGAMPFYGLGEVFCNLMDVQCHPHQWQYVGMVIGLPVGVWKAMKEKYRLLK